MPLDLTIVIPVKNEAGLLSDCLNAIGVGFAKKIVVVDSTSTDETPLIAKRYGAELINFTWNGHFPKKRNWYLRNHKPDTAWVMFLDTDEFLTDDFKNELITTLKNNTQHHGFILKYSIYFMNKKMTGGYPLKKLALFRVGAGEYERIEEDHWSQMDMEIHEHPIIKGSVGIIRSKIDHRDNKSIDAYWKKHQEYASWEARRYLRLKTDQLKVQWSFQQQIKYLIIQTPLIGPCFFIGSYFLMGGFINGYRGLAFNILKAAYFTLIYCKIKEYQQTSS